MSQERTSYGMRQAARSTTHASSASSSGPPPGPTHTPSPTPVIAGSLVGVIVMVVCVVTVLLVHKRRRRLLAERVLRSPQYPDGPVPTNFLRDQLDKPSSLNVYGERPLPPPGTQDSASSSASCAPTPSGLPPLNHDSRHPPRSPIEGIRSHSTHPPRHRHTNHSNNHDPQDHQPLPPFPEIFAQKPGQSSTSSAQPTNQSLSHSQTHSILIPLTHPQANFPQMVPESTVPRGHAVDAGDVMFDNNNLVSSSPSAIFGVPKRSDANEQTASKEGFGGSKAGVPAIVVTRDVEGSWDERQERFKGKKWEDRDPVGEPPPMPANGVLSGNGNDGWRSGTPDTPGGCSHAQGYKQGGEEVFNEGRQDRGASKYRATASGSEYSYRASGSGCGSTEGADSSCRMGDTDRVGLTPDCADHGRPRTTSGSTSGSIPLPPPSTSPTTFYSPPTHNKFAGQQNTQQQKYAERNTANNTYLLPSVLPFTRRNRSFVGRQEPIALSHLGTGTPTTEDEDAPPAYENIWATPREEERLRLERRQAERQHESRT